MPDRQGNADGDVGEQGVQGGDSHVVLEISPLRRVLHTSEDDIGTLDDNFVYRIIARDHQGSIFFGSFGQCEDRV